MLNQFPCPECGKTMVEAKKWPGLWQCPDFVAPLNPETGPPFQYKCRGLHLTDEGIKGFNEAMLSVISERN